MVSHTKVVYLGWAIAILFCLLHLSVALRVATFDALTPPQRRVQRQYDDTQNSVRAESIGKYGYRSNPVLPAGIPQFFLMTGVLTHLFVPESYPSTSRYTIALRVTAAVCFVLCLLVFYWLANTLFRPTAALWVWSCFAAGTGAYASAGYIAKENSLALLFCVLTIAIWRSYFDDKKIWKLFLSAIVIGLGGATKQYPLLLSLLLIPISWERHRSLSKSGKLLFLLALTTGLSLVLVNPTYYPGFSLARAGRGISVPRSPSRRLRR